MNNENPQCQWYQDRGVFTVVPGLCFVHSGTRNVFCSQCYQDGGVFTDHCGSVFTDWSTGT